MHILYIIYKYTNVRYILYIILYIRYYYIIYIIYNIYNIYYKYILLSLGFEHSVCRGTLTITYIYIIYIMYIIFVVYICCICCISSKRRSSRSDVFKKIGVLRNFTKFAGKHLCRSHSLDARNFIKTKTPAQVFFCVFQNF